MATIDVKKIEAQLSALTATHKPELNMAYMDASGQKLKNDDKNTADLNLFTEDRAGEIYAYMRAALGKKPSVI